MHDEWVFEVEGFPPIKNEAKSLLSPSHGYHDQVQRLLGSVRAQLPKDFRPVEYRLALEVTLICDPEHVPNGDATNYLGGITDVLQAVRRNLPSDGGIYLFKDDQQVRQITYREEAGRGPRYKVRV